MSPLTLLRSATRAIEDASHSHRPQRRTRLGVLRLEASGLPEDCAAHFDVLAEDGRVIAEGSVETDIEARERALPEGVYRLRWRPTDALIDGRVHTFVPTVLERRIRVTPGSEEADGSATYVCVRRAACMATPAA